jgi:hypothetical protein
MIRNLIKIILIILLLALPTSCEMIKPIIIEDAANIGAVDITLTYDESLFAITDIADGAFDVTESNLEHNETGWVRIAAFQMDNPGLNGRVSLASVTLAGNLDDLGSLSMTVNTLRPLSAIRSTVPLRISRSRHHRHPHPLVPDMEVVVQVILPRHQRHPLR